MTIITDISENHISEVQRICESTGFFRDDEINVAVELVSEAFHKGQAKSGYYFIFAVENGKTCGFACFGPTPCTIGTFDLYWIVVDKMSRGKGIGMQMLARVESELRNLNARKLYIETSSSEKYLPTIGFYNKAGYSVEAVLNDFYLPGDNKIIFSKTINKKETP